MQYGKAYGYFLNREGGATSTLLASLALASTAVIPVVGQLVFLGYQAEVTEDLEHDPALEDHDDFSFDNLVRYLKRGVWPFLMHLIVGAIAAVGLVAAIAVGGVVAWSLEAPWVAVAAYFVLLTPVLFLSSLFSLPLVLHTQLTGELRVGAAFAFASRFLGKLWGQCLVTLFVHFLISGVLTTVGLLCCCVGVYPATVVVMMAQDHLSVQLYRLYLAEGGEPVGSAAEEAEYRDE